MGYFKSWLGTLCDCGDKKTTSNYRHPNTCTKCAEVERDYDYLTQHQCSIWWDRHKVSQVKIKKLRNHLHSVIQTKKKATAKKGKEKVERYVANI